MKVTEKGVQGSRLAKEPIYAHPVRCPIDHMTMCLINYDTDYGRTLCHKSNQQVTMLTGHPYLIFCPTVPKTPVVRLSLCIERLFQIQIQSKSPSIFQQAVFLQDLQVIRFFGKKQSCLTPFQKLHRVQTLKQQTL